MSQLIFWILLLMKVTFLFCSTVVAISVTASNQNVGNENAYLVQSVVIDYPTSILEFKTDNNTFSTKAIIDLNGGRSKINDSVNVGVVVNYGGIIDQQLLNFGTVAAPDVRRFVKVMYKNPGEDWQKDRFGWVEAAALGEPFKRTPEELTRADGLRDGTSRNTEAGMCAECGGSVSSPNTESIEELLKILNEQVLVEDSFLPLASSGETFNKQCNNFIGTDGSIGRWGALLVKSLKTVGENKAKKLKKDCFFSNNTPLVTDSLCPNFKNFSSQQKEHFWAYTFASYAHHESSCRPDISAEGVNDKADGLLQLEYSRNQRKRSGRDQKFCKTDKGIETRDLGFQFECAAAIIIDTLCAKGYPLNSKTSQYWHEAKNEVEGRTGYIVQKIKSYPACK